MTGERAAVVAAKSAAATTTVAVDEDRSREGREEITGAQREREHRLFLHYLSFSIYDAASLSLDLTSVPFAVRASQTWKCIKRTHSTRRGRVRGSEWKEGEKEG